MSDAPNDLELAVSKPTMFLLVARGETRGRVFAIEEGSNLLGRWDPDAGAFPEIDLEREDVDAKISRKHAVIIRNGPKASIQDAGSLNGTFLNRGARLEAGVEYPLKHGDEIIIGKTFLRFEVAQDDGATEQSD